MKSKVWMWKIMTLIGVLLLGADIAFAEGEVKAGNKQPVNIYTGMDSISLSRHLIHQFGIDFRPTFIIPTNPFLDGDNYYMQPIRRATSTHLKYSFKFQSGSFTDRIYRGVYQGIGIGYFNLGDKKELGNPLALYLFQGARIAQIIPRLSFNYEWNFGVSFGWKPYNNELNRYNMIIGSKANAYLNTNFYLSWMLSRQFDLATGVTLSHFSNGNTKFPNAGLNTIGLKLGLIYNFNANENLYAKPMFLSSVPHFPKHISYDLVLFGSWRRKGVAYGDEQIASPDAYAVCGFNFAPMYNLGYSFRAGVSLDGVYDGSSNVYTADYISGTEQQFYKPAIKKQLALGLSARAEYVMPYFTVGIGLGTNVLHAGGDMKGFYQVLALKIEVTRSSFIHIGYNLKDFHDPNYLMLGIGYRFNNKYPTFHR